jgi:hypothetical protein
LEEFSFAVVVVASGGCQEIVKGLYAPRNLERSKARRSKIRNVEWIKGPNESDDENDDESGVASGPEDLEVANSIGARAD